ncbi:hypothetical protein CUU52_02690 [Pectobacterium polaris]|nr:hypothetical protein [Pectobacterium polaris]
MRSASHAVDDWVVFRIGTKESFTAVRWPERENLSISDCQPYVGFFDAGKSVLRMRGFAQWNGQFLPAPPLVRIMYIMLN